MLLYFDCQLEYVAPLIPCSRQRSATGTLLSPCFEVARIWLSVNRDFFMSFSNRIKGR